MITLLSGFATHEREVIRERSLAGTNRRARNGAWMGRVVPYGYRKVGEKDKAHITPSEEPLPGLDLSEAEIIRAIYRMFGHREEILLPYYGTSEPDRSALLLHSRRASGDPRQTQEPHFRPLAARPRPQHAG